MRMKRRVGMLVFSLVFLSVLLAVLVTLTLRSRYGSIVVAEREIDGDVIIAVIDTGISTAAIAPEKVLPGFNYVMETDDTADTIGHGTAITSIILGSEPAGVTGIAPDSKVVPLVVTCRNENDDIVSIEPAALAEVIRDGVDNFGADVINLSIGTVTDSKEMRSAVAYVQKCGTVVVASVANNNTEGDVLYPAGYPGVIGVGAVDKNNQVSSFSQKSKAVKLVAPGEDFWMASREGKKLGAKGTSYAAAFVSGAAAALLKASPKLTPDEIRDILCNSALDLGYAGYDEESGYGALQIDKALAMAAEQEH